MYLLYIDKIMTLIFLFRWVCDDFPDMKIPLENNILCDYDTKS